MEGGCTGTAGDAVETDDVGAVPEAAAAEATVVVKAGPAKLPSANVRKSARASGGGEVRAAGGGRGLAVGRGRGRGRGRGCGRNAGGEAGSAGGGNAAGSAGGGNARGSKRVRIAAPSKDVKAANNEARSITSAVKIPIERHRWGMSEP